MDTPSPELCKRWKKVECCSPLAVLNTCRPKKTQVVCQNTCPLFSSIQGGPKAYREDTQQVEKKDLSEENTIAQNREKEFAEDTFSIHEIEIEEVAIDGICGVY